MLSPNHWATSKFPQLGILTLLYPLAGLTHVFALANWRHSHTWVIEDALTYRSGTSARMAGLVGACVGFFLPC